MWTWLMSTGRLQEYVMNQCWFVRLEQTSGDYSIHVKRRSSGLQDPSLYVEGKDLRSLLLQIIDWLNSLG